MPPERPQPPAGSPQQTFFVVLGGVMIAAVVMLLILRGQRPEPRGGLPSGHDAPAIVAAGWLNEEPPPQENRRVTVVHAWATF